MKTTVERINPTRVKINAVISPAELQPALDHAYEHIAEQVNIPGFRKGKVPAKILEQRVGKPAIMAHAINDGLNEYYSKAMTEHKLTPLAAPQADVKQAPDENTWEGDLIVDFEVEVRPEIKLPNIKGMKVVVDDAKVTDKEVSAELDNLRARFGALKTVSRAAKSGDFVKLNLIATIDGKTIDTAENISYEIGSGKMLDGLDEAIDTLTADETTTFKSKLAGGDNAGQEAEITVTVTEVQERELPKADDAFAQLASEFDTLAELKADLEKQLESAQIYTQGIQARDILMEELLKSVDVPVSQVSVDEETNRHLEGEGRLEDDAHRAEVNEQNIRTFKIQMILDAVADQEDVKVTENELLQFLFMNAQQYGMEANEFIKVIQENGQMNGFVGEVRRRNALSVVLENAKVTDKKGKDVDITAYLKSDVDLDAESHEGHDH
ncbi:MAG: trigger factor [Micrococcales bacterium]